MALVTTTIAGLNDDQYVQVEHEDRGQREVTRALVHNRGFVPLRVIVRYPLNGNVDPPPEVFNKVYEHAIDPYIEPVPAGLRFNQIQKSTNFLVELST